MAVLAIVNMLFLVAGFLMRLRRNGPVHQETLGNSAANQAYIE